MRVAIDGREIGRVTDAGGVYHYTMHLIRHLRRVDPATRYVVFFTASGARHRDTCRRAMARVAAEGVAVRRAPIPQDVWMRLHIPANLFLGRVDVFHGPFDSLPPLVGCRRVVTVHDLRYLEVYPELPRLVPELASVPAGFLDLEAWHAFHRAQARRLGVSAADADRIVAVSRFTGHALARRFPEHAHKVRVIHNGLASYFLEGPGAGRPLETPYFLFVGQLDPFKNLLRLVQAAARLWNEAADLSHRLVLITPTRTWNRWYRALLEQEVRRLGVARRVRILEGVPDRELPAWYAGADALLLPSLYEGFGLPALEAMACGTAVVASPRGALPEILGDAPLWVDPLRVEELAEAMHRLAARAGERRAAAARGRARARGFAWERTARETARLYREVCA